MQYRPFAEFGAVIRFDCPIARRSSPRRRRSAPLRRAAPRSSGAWRPYRRSPSPRRRARRDNPRSAVTNSGCTSRKVAASLGVELCRHTIEVVGGYALTRAAGRSEARQELKAPSCASAARGPERTAKITTAAHPLVRPDCGGRNEFAVIPRDGSRRLSSRSLRSYHS